MAEGTLAHTLITFKDTWPDGEVLTKDECGFSPYQITSSTAGHDATAPAFPIGTKVDFFQPGVTGKTGSCRFIYLLCGTQQASIAALSVVTQGSATLWYEVNNKASAAIANTSGCAAVAIGAMTNAKYGWYLCGGVVPTDFVPAMTGNFVTDALTVAGAVGVKSGATSTTIVVLAKATTLMGVFGYAIAAQS
jgi:hypothetical protein